ncbi:hypothetical protein GGI43DRAFT_75839 [Trichoderma evansii]
MSHCLVPRQHVIGLVALSSWPACSHNTGTGCTHLAITTLLPEVCYMSWGSITINTGHQSSFKGAAKASESVSAISSSCYMEWCQV